jgi:hypothetical protein
MRLALVALMLAACSLPLAAASVKDLVGTWTVDVDATWLKLKDLPELKALPPEMASMAKAAFSTQGAGMTFTFTDTLLTTMIGAVKREEHYVVISTDSDSITTESPDAEGKKERSIVKFVDGAMELMSVSDPAKKVVLKRK